MKEIFLAFNWLVRGLNKKAIIALLLFVLLGLFQGVGLVLIVPLLSITGIKSLATKIDSSLIDNATYFFKLLHIPITFINVLIFFVLIISGYSFLRFKSAIVNQSITQTYSNTLRKKLHALIIESEWIMIVQVKSSDLIGLLSREISQISYGLTILTQFTGTLIVLIVHIIMAFFISFQITAWVLFCGIILFFLQKKLLSSSLSNGKRNRQFLSDLQSNLQEHFHNIKLAKSQNLNEQQKDSLNTISNKMLHNQISHTRQKATSDFTYDVGTAILICLFLYIVFQVYNEPVLDLMILIYVFSRILPAFKSCFSSIQSLLNIVPIINDVRERMFLFEKHEENIGFSVRKDYSFKDSIELKNVSFQYSEKKKTISHINLQIKKGRITSITGASGEGKSTLADIITGLLKPSSGVVLIDGISLHEIGYKNWRDKIAYMTQERFLFHDSIKNNLLWSNPMASEEDLWLALSQSNASEYIKQLPDGINTIVGDRGIRLSGGQRQRIALAMALVRKPDLLILDEATNELDESNEKEIYDTIFQLKESMTIFIITHRLSSMKMADDAYLFKDGEISKWEGI
jgi:ATP-binding cassette, subfamily C, bacterial